MKNQSVYILFNLKVKSFLLCPSLDASLLSLSSAEVVSLDKISESQIMSQNFDQNYSLLLYLKDLQKTREKKQKTSLVLIYEKETSKKEITLRTKRMGDINIIETMEKMGNLQLKWKKF